MDKNYCRAPQEICPRRLAAVINRRFEIFFSHTKKKLLKKKTLYIRTIYHDDR